MKRLQTIAEQFAGHGTTPQITPLGNGLINDTYLVICAGKRFVLQGINRRVFPEPNQVVANLRQLNRHVAAQTMVKPHLRIPVLLETVDNQPCHTDPNGEVWRALELIEPAESREQLSNDIEASQVGFALAHFHKLCAGLPTDELYDTLPGFHITPLYFQNYQGLLEQPLQVVADAEYWQCRQFIDQSEARISELEQAKERGELRERVIHGDPKLNNFLFVPGSDHIVSLVDLDTVKPGLVHYDIGDCLRSCCHIPETNEFDLDRCQIILDNYLREAGEFFTTADYDYLFSAVWLIPFELGLRFFSDYLNGNQYFKVSTPRQNLERALALFALCDSIDQKRAILERLISQCQD